jgi:hypothetical protein
MTAHVRDFYVDSSSSLVIGLFPDVVAWLIERAALPPDLAERS